MSNSYDADVEEAHYRNTVIEGRKKVLDTILAMFDGVQETDPKFIVEAIEDDLLIRDGLIYWASDKCQIEIFGDEIAIDDCSDRRRELAGFLLYNMIQTGKGSPHVVGLLSALALLDNAPDASVEVLGLLDEDNMPSLGKLILLAYNHMGGLNAYRQFKASVESNTLYGCLAGAN